MVGSSGISRYSARNQNLVSTPFPRTSQPQQLGLPRPSKRMLPGIKGLSCPWSHTHLQMGREARANTPAPRQISRVYASTLAIAQRRVSRCVRHKVFEVRISMQPNAGHSGHCCHSCELRAGAESWSGSFKVASMGVVQRDPLRRADAHPFVLASSPSAHVNHAAGVHHGGHRGPLGKIHLRQDIQ